MDQLINRIEQELEAAERAGQAISEAELAQKLSQEFSSVCGQADVRAAVAVTMRRRLKQRIRDISYTRRRA
jgi:hypothetical protein